ncbi:hypothetical protein GWI33_007607 [Rhynchophorus ferrugineus]|uniref:uS12 prolyl 3-hydroxylase n=1 Tax=Rhynchophorus ferrugineus TaxID=354439 RepID=A0A834IHI1_RHYFE|nr:hypothetical protein GWI33_007607 [Rhynchophorus ferrugineus]
MVYTAMNENKNKRKCDFETDEANFSDSNASDCDDFSYTEDISESEPELECEDWDKDCKILAGFSRFQSITGCHLMPTCGYSDEPCNKKKKEQPLSIRPKLKSSVSDFQKSWLGDTPISNENFDLITDPFKVSVTKEMVEDATFLDKLRWELYNVNLNVRNMDLYEFFQSKDLKYLNLPEVTRFYDFLKSDVMNWVSSITGYHFSHISATFSLYSNTDYLLVHDDQRDDRKVAFILYLTDDFGWNEIDGGRLLLLRKDKRGQPHEVVQSILPANNQFIFFPVTNDSYHQVEEVKSLTKCRLSINGWFHTKDPPVFHTPPYEPLPNSLFSDYRTRPNVVDIELESWINDEYLEPKVVKSIQQYIEENSEISLKQFLKVQCFTEILEQLQSSVVQWIKVGPPNRIAYDIILDQQLPHIVERFLNLFRSTAIFELLQRYTDLDLTTDKATVKFELQRWTPGSYALLTDYDWKERNELDLILYLGCNEPSDVIGARTQYITMEDEVQNALITIEPEDNSLNIVYRDSARFTKYFSSQSKCQCFYTLICSYSE